MNASEPVNCDVQIVPDLTAQTLREYVRENPELIYDEYDHEADREQDSLNGGCYVLAECYFHASGGTDSALDIYCLSWQNVDPSLGGTHWYLRDADRGVWIDLGLDNIADAEGVPFEAGTRRAFITGYEPSKRARSVLEALSLDY